jgi:hypothetical protein
MVFGIDEQWGKTMFWVLRQFAFSQSSFLAVVLLLIGIDRR